MCMRERERERATNKKLLDVKKEKEIGCLTMFSAKPMIEIAEILMRKPIPHGKFI